MPDSLISRLVPVLILAGIVLFALLAWKLFPMLQGWAAAQGCIASGHTNCG